MPKLVWGQGNDVGTQYRSLVLYTTEAQKQAAEQFIAELNASTGEGEPTATEVHPLTAFYPAEQEHLDYYAKHPEKAYCQLVIAPKLQKVQKEFSALLARQS